jgi:ATP-dependent Clp protease protease subunit
MTMPLARLLAAALLCGPAAAQNRVELSDVLNRKAKVAARAAAPAAPAGAPSAPGSSASSPTPSPSENGGASASAAAPAPGAAAAPGTPAKSEERAALEKLTTENQLVREEVAKRFRDLVVEKEELRIRSEVNTERQKAELAKLEAEYQRLALENRLNEERNKRSLDELSAAQRRLAAENSLDEEKHKKELADLRQSREKLQQDNDILREKLRAEEMKSNSEKMALDLEGARMASAGAKLRLEREKLEEKVTRLKVDLEERSKKEDWRSEANREPVVLKQPFKDGVLTISDRRITLNGPVIRGVAQDIIERIGFFNNVSEDPIFLVIDSSPGGSVMEGHRIVKAIEASKAPVHVVVKGFAASMAAIIATLAPHSYVYPNAVILHHQPWNLSFGNPVQQKEQLEILRAWYDRLGTPVAKKMGITLDQLTKRMYEKNSEGDWQEFGDKAVAARWADSVVEEIQETGVTKRPTEGKKAADFLFAQGLEEKVDERGERYVRLPRLDPFDAYWIYNPDRYYR